MAMKSCDPWYFHGGKLKLDEDKKKKRKKKYGTSCRSIHTIGVDCHPPLSNSSRPDLPIVAICMCAPSFAVWDHVVVKIHAVGTSGSAYNLLGDRLSSYRHRFYFIKEHVENGVIELYFVNTEYQLADIFTKALGRERIEFLINKLGMRSFTPDTLKQLADEVDE
ncbi:hypothetical protein Tco_0003229 [Tanacetum coccineum]